MTSSIMKGILTFILDFPVSMKWLCRSIFFSDKSNHIAMVVIPYHNHYVVVQNRRIEGYSQNALLHVRIPCIL